LPADRPSIEVRSYRGVFALERRVYRIDSLRLHPAGVPLRGVAYVLALILASIAFGSLPPISLIPWYVRSGAIPLVLGGVLTAMRIDGRTVHLSLRALLGWRLGPRSLTRFAKTPRARTRWRPPALLCIPDGSDASLRAIRYRGPGVALIAVAHERVEWRRRPHLTIEPLGERSALSQPVAVELRAGTELEVRAERGRTRR
jgi:hypothetical protein